MGLLFRSCAYSRGGSQPEGRRKGNLGGLAVRVARVLLVRGWAVVLRILRDAIELIVNVAMYFLLEFGNEFAKSS